jgi:predicted enzyme related to lactoylglutathione lyase
MAHHSAIRVIVIDVPEDDHDRELAFWQGAIGKELRHIERYPEFHGARLPHEEQLGLLVQRLGEGQPRVHLDIHTTDVAAEVDRLEKLGASQERQVHDWTIMRDPAGLPFCVIPAREGELDDENAQRWDH